MGNQAILLNEICHVCGKVYKATMHEINRTCPVCREKLSELKESYFKQAVLNCISAEKETMPLLNLEAA